MKLPGSGIPMRDKIPMYFVLLFALTVAVMVIFKIPAVLTSWEDASRLQQEFRIGVAGLIFLVIVGFWVVTHRAQYHQMDRIRLGFLFVAFFFNPIFSFIRLAITSDGFKASPAVLGNEQLYTRLDEIQFYLFLAMAIGALIWYFKRRALATKLENPESIGEHLL